MFGYSEYFLTKYVSVFKYRHGSVCVSGEAWIYRNGSEQIIPEKEEKCLEQEGLSPLRSQ